MFGTAHAINNLRGCCGSLSLPQNLRAVTMLGTHVRLSKGSSTLWNNLHHAAQISPTMKPLSVVPHQTMGPHTVEKDVQSHVGLKIKIPT